MSKSYIKPRCEQSRNPRCVMLCRRRSQEDWVTIKGQRFFRTGDIGQINKDGSLSIIDRKKDLLSAAETTGRG